MANIAIPRDIFGQPVQALTPDANATVSIGAASANVALPAGSEVVRVPTGATHIAVIQNGVVTGTASVTRLV